MNKIKKGAIVVRKSHGKDIIFYVKRLIKTKESTIAILRGLTERIEAYSDIDDLVLVEKDIIQKKLLDEKEKIQKRVDKKYGIGIISKEESRLKEKIITGKILHLDGDKRYSQKSYNYYKKLGLDATVKNIPEYKQPKVVYQLLKIYKPDILIVTGHDRDDKKRNKL